MKLQHSVVVLGGLFALADTSSAGVIVVDAAGGGSFTQIQPAVDAAIDGDTILVKPGNYAAFTINAKGLTVVGDVGTITIPKATVRDTSSTQTVTLSNLKANGVSSVSPAFGVLNCAGAVRVVACDWNGRDEIFPSFGSGHGGEVTNSSSVAFAGCTITGGDGALMANVSCVPGSQGSPGRDAFYVDNSSVAMYDTLTRGGQGGNGEAQSFAGGWGAHLHSGFMFAGRSNITGGPGSNAACDWLCPTGGGYGWYVDSIASAWELDCMVSGGLSGTGFIVFVGCAVWVPVPAPAYYDEVPFQFAVPSIGFMSPHIAREGTFVHVKFIGPPGARVFLNDELTTTFEAVASWRGVLISPFPPTGAPVRAIKWGVIPASGELTRTYAVPQLPAGEQAQTRFLQAYRVGANGITLGSFRTLTILDSAL